MKKIIKNDFIIQILLFVVLLPSVLSLFHPGFPPTHDGEYHLIRFYEFWREFSFGSLYPRWAPDLNFTFGIPLFNFVYPLPNYIALLLHQLGFSFVSSFKLSMILASFIGGFSMYFWSKCFWGKGGGFLSAVVYTYTPYHFVDVYVRGSIGEVWALAFAPFLLYTSTKAIFNKSFFWQGVSALSLAAVIFSHNILGLAFFIFYLLYSVFLIKVYNKGLNGIKKVLIISIFGLGIASIFWIPALSEKNIVKGLELYSVESNFPELAELIFPSWGTGFVSSTFNNKMSLQLGVINIFFVLLSLFILLKVANSRRSANIFYILLFFLVSYFFTFFLMTAYSKIFWRLPLISYFQFPWRLLSIEMLISAFLSGAVFFNGLISVNKKYLVLPLFVLLSIILTYGYTVPAYYHDRTDSYYINKSNFIDGTNSPGDLFNTIWFKTVSLRPEKKFILEEGLGNIASVKQLGSKYLVSVVSKNKVKVLGNISYFPGWSYVSDGKTKSVNNEKGIISFTLPKGRNSVIVVFKNTQVRSFATIITLLSFFLVLGLTILSTVKSWDRRI